MLHGEDITEGGVLPRSMGLDINSVEGGRIERNIHAHQKGTGSSATVGIRVSQQNNGHVVNCIDNIQYDWEYVSGLSCIESTNFSWVGTNTNNHLSLDGKDALGVDYPDPGRDIYRYDDEVLGGPGTLEHFYQEICAREGGEWPENLSAAYINNWIRAGFGRDPI